MYNLEQCVFVTNNDRVALKFKDSAKEIIFLEEYRDVLIKSRDLIYSGYKLLTHPQASSLKPNQTPYRSILLYNGKHILDEESVMLIEKAIENFDKWQDIRKTPEYDSKIANDYKTIDLSMIENIIPKL